MSASASMIQPGMDVFGSDAEHVGRVREVRTGVILVERPKGALAIPRNVILEVSEAERRVDLTVPAAQATDFREQGMV
jgi:hypothetical protein